MCLDGAFPIGGDEEDGGFGLFDDFLGDVAFDEAGEHAFAGETQEDDGGALFGGGFDDGVGGVVGKEEEGVNFELFAAELEGDLFEGAFTGGNFGATPFGAVDDVDGEEAGVDAQSEIGDRVHARIGRPTFGDSQHYFAHIKFRFVITTMGIITQGGEGR